MNSWMKLLRSLTSGYTAILVIISISILASGIHTTYFEDQEFKDMAVSYSIASGTTKSLFIPNPPNRRGEVLHLSITTNTTLQNFLVSFTDGNQTEVFYNHSITRSTSITHTIPFKGNYHITVSTQDTVQLKIHIRVTGFPSIITTTVLICWVLIAVNLLLQFLRNEQKTMDSELEQADQSTSMLSMFQLSVRPENYLFLGLIFLLLFPSLFSFHNFETSYIIYSWRANTPSSRIFLLYLQQMYQSRILLFQTIGVGIVLLPKFMNSSRNLLMHEQSYPLDPRLKQIREILYLQNHLFFVFAFSWAMSIYDTYANGRSYPYLLPLLFSLSVFYLSSLTLETAIFCLFQILDNPIIQLICTVIPYFVLSSDIRNLPKIFDFYWSYPLTHINDPNYAKYVPLVFQHLLINLLVYGIVLMILVTPNKRIYLQNFVQNFRQEIKNFKGIF